MAAAEKGSLGSWRPRAERGLVVEPTPPDDQKAAEEEEDVDGVGGKGTAMAGRAVI